ncbi:MAG: hypothetical protein LBG16_00930, partial [Elusimicrobiota bacterium]|nr:hypothetical protein [Elusimicrobiota bacterium]
KANLSNKEDKKMKKIAMSVAALMIFCLFSFAQIANVNDGQLKQTKKRQKEEMVKVEKAVKKKIAESQTNQTIDKYDALIKLAYNVYLLEESNNDSESAKNLLLFALQEWQKAEEAIMDSFKKYGDDTVTPVNWITVSAVQKLKKSFNIETKFDKWLSKQNIKLPDGWEMDKHICCIVRAGGTCSCK